MKQSAVKTLGVAALGAAFAAFGAGAAHAAPAVPDTTQSLNDLTRTLPTENVSQVLPADAGKVTGQGPAAPVADLLGGVVPASGVTVNGLPLR